jgi:glutamate synthase (NADPH/NADH) large chain
MTGGVVVVLGETGLNFGAGMTGGFSFVLDLFDHFPQRYNQDVDLHRITTETMGSQRDFLRKIIFEFVKETGSTWGKQVLDQFSDYESRFWLVKPIGADIASLLEILEQAA